MLQIIWCVSTRQAQWCQFRLSVFNMYRLALEKKRLRSMLTSDGLSEGYRTSNSTQRHQWLPLNASHWNNGVVCCIPILETQSAYLLSDWLVMEEVTVPILSFVTNMENPWKEAILRWGHLKWQPGNLTWYDLKFKFAEKLWKGSMIKC